MLQTELIELANKQKVECERQNSRMIHRFLALAGDKMVIKAMHMFELDQNAFWWLKSAVH